MLLFIDRKIIAYYNSKKDVFHLINIFFCKKDVFNSIFNEERKSELQKKRFCSEKDGKCERTGIIVQY